MNARAYRLCALSPQIMISSRREPTNEQRNEEREGTGITGFIICAENPGEFLRRHFGCVSVRECAKQFETRARARALADIEEAYIRVIIDELVLWP